MLRGWQLRTVAALLSSLCRVGAREPRAWPGAQSMYQTAEKHVALSLYIPISLVYFQLALIVLYVYMFVLSLVFV